jgi:hypothetical protein
VPDAAEGGVASSVSGASESGVPDVSGTVLSSTAVPDGVCTPDGGACVREAGGAGSGGTVGK